MRWNGTFQHEAKKVKRYWLEFGNFASHQRSNKFKCNATRLCNLPILTSQNMARRTSILTLHIGNRRISYHAEKNRSNSSVSNTGLRFGDCLCNVSFFFNPYFPLTNTYERQICSLRHTLILYSIQFFLDCMEFFWLRGNWVGKRGCFVRFGNRSAIKCYIRFHFF